MRNFSTMSFECSICEEMNAQMLIGFSTWWDESKIKYFKSTTWSAFTSSCPIGWNFDGAWLIKILLQITIMEFSSTKMDKISRSFPQKKLLLPYPKAFERPVDNEVSMISKCSKGA